MSKLRLLDLFSGIGGFSLGLERSGGFETVAFCEIEEYPRRVLKRHWPEVPCYHDIRELTAERLAADGIAVDAICGGFPCQDISTAGKGAGIEGERSGLWTEYARLIGELRPRVMFVENVAALLGRGIGRVLGDLAALGYDAEWHCIPASAVGAPHRRDRVWVTAYPQHSDANGARPHRAALHVIGETKPADEQKREPRSVGAFLADADGLHVQGKFSRSLDARIRQVSRERQAGSQGAGIGRVWASEPAVGRLADGLPHRVDRLKALGNAVVPQIPELLGRAWMEAQA